MNLRWLYYFNTIADLEHYTKAAQHLHISQSNLSHAIREMEEELGVELFEHTGRNIQLTQSGAIFMGCGYDMREDTSFNPFHYYAGKIIGTFLDWFIPFFLFCVVVVMISGAGATLNQYFGLPNWIGSTLMATLATLSVLLGLQKLIDIIVFILGIIALVCGQLPFGQLVGIIYPYTGYIEIAFLAIVAVKTYIIDRNIKA